MVSVEHGRVISLEFLDKDEMFRARMVEKIYHIEQYKHEGLKNEGRKLSSEATTLEWIQNMRHSLPALVATNN